MSQSAEKRQWGVVEFWVNCRRYCLQRLNQRSRRGRHGAHPHDTPRSQTRHTKYRHRYEGYSSRTYVASPKSLQIQRPCGGRAAPHPQICSVQRSEAPSAPSSTQQTSSDPGPHSTSRSATGPTAQGSLPGRRCALAPVCVIAYGATALGFIAAFAQESLRKAHPPGMSQAGCGRGRLQYARSVRCVARGKPGTAYAAGLRSPSILLHSMVRRGPVRGHGRAGWGGAYTGPAHYITVL